MKMERIKEKNVMRKKIQTNEETNPILISNVYI